MNNKFDELAKTMAQSVTRRGALKQFGVGLAGIALATVGLANKAHADKGGRGDDKKACNHCRYPYGCDTLYPIGSPEFNQCVGLCYSIVCNPQ